MIINFFFSILLTKSYEILLIDWHSSIKIGSNLKYSGTLSTALTFIVYELANDTNTTIQCYPIDDVFHSRSR